MRYLLCFLVIALFTCESYASFFKSEEDLINTISKLCKQFGDNYPNGNSLIEQLNLVSSSDSVAFNNIKKKLFYPIPL